MRLSVPDTAPTVALIERTATVMPPDRRFLEERELSACLFETTTSVTPR